MGEAVPDFGEQFLVASQHFVFPFVAARVFEEHPRAV
jgi:hypothetical protein